MKLDLLSEVLSPRKRPMPCARMNFKGTGLKLGFFRNIDLKVLFFQFPHLAFLIHNTLPSPDEMWPGTGGGFKVKKSKNLTVF